MNERTCMTCRHCLEECCDYGVCAMRMCRSPRDFNNWGEALSYIDGNRVDMQEDTCDWWEAESMGGFGATCYVVHKGEEVVAIGTIDEVAEALGVKLLTVQFLTSPSNHRKWNMTPDSKRLVIDKVEVDE